MGIGITVVNAVVQAFQRLTDRTEQKHTGGKGQSFTGHRCQLGKGITFAKKMSVYVGDQNLELIDFRVFLQKLAYFLA